MYRNEFLNHNIYVPNVWDESIIAYLNLGFICLFKIDYRFCFVRLWTQDLVPDAISLQLYKLRLCTDEDLHLFKTDDTISKTKLSQVIRTIYISDANIFLKRINHNMYE